MAAIYIFYIDKTGIDSNISLIGGQFDFKAGIYYPASLIEQYKIPRTNLNRNKYIHYIGRFVLE